MTRRRKTLRRTVALTAATLAVPLSFAGLVFGAPALPLGDDPPPPLPSRYPLSVQPRDDECVRQVSFTYVAGEDNGAATALGAVRAFAPKVPPLDGRASGVDAMIFDDIENGRRVAAFEVSRPPEGETWVLLRAAYSVPCGRPAEDKLP